jgi:hypothetical protein
MQLCIQTLLISSHDYRKPFCIKNTRENSVSFVDSMHTQTKITVNIMVNTFVDTHRTTFESNLCDGGDLRLTC